MNLSEYLRLQQEAYNRAAVQGKWQRTDTCDYCGEAIKPSEQGYCPTRVIHEAADAVAEGVEPSDG